MTETTAPNARWIERWQEDEGSHWVTAAERYDTINGAFGEAMFDAAELQPGERVLDVGCGNGTTTIEAAKRVQPEGAAVGVDVSPPMLTLARERAASTGVEAIEFLEADAQVHPFEEGSFDVLVSRNGLMFFDDPHAAFTNLAHALRSGGRVAFVAPQGFERNEWIMAAATAAAPHIGVPEGVAPGAPGPLGLADPDQTRRILERAGFVEIAIDDVTRPICIGDDVDDALGFLRSMPLVRDLFAAAPADQQVAAEHAVREALEPFAGPDGVITENNGSWLVTAQR